MAVVFRRLWWGLKMKSKRLLEMIRTRLDTEAYWVEAVGSGAAIGNYNLRNTEITEVLSCRKS